MYILLSHILMTIPFSLEWYESGEGLGHSYLLCMRLGYTHCLLLLLLSILINFFSWLILATTDLLSRFHDLTVEMSALELNRLNEHLEVIFHGKASKSSDFDSSSSSPQILPAIQDSFGPTAPKG